ncbi:striatin-like, partial [Nomascus leucogenys]|uniref:striatin-like n=1 Tax=Nomascus leucogenys TaxID=61853 RepID=UPI00122D8C3E
MENKAYDSILMQLDNSLFSLLSPPNPPPLFWLGHNRSKLQDMLANLRDVDEIPSLQPSVGSPSRPNSSRLPEHEINRADEVEALTFLPSSGKSFIMGADEALESELGLGELAGLTVANEADSLTYD